MKKHCNKKNLKEQVGKLLKPSQNAYLDGALDTSIYARTDEFDNPFENTVVYNVIGVEINTSATSQFGRTTYPQADCDNPPASARMGFEKIKKMRGKIKRKEREKEKYVKSRPNQKDNKRNVREVKLSKKLRKSLLDLYKKN